MIRRLLPALLCLLSLPAAAQTGYVFMTGANLTDPSGDPIQNATACFQQQTLAGTPIAVHVGGTSTGQASGAPVCGPVNNGALVGTWTNQDPTAAGTNLVPDPGITAAIGVNWTQPGSFSVASGVTTTDPGSGPAITANVLLAGSAASGSFQFSHTTATVVPGQHYTVSGYVDASQVTAGSPAVIILNPGTGIAILQLNQPAGSLGWLYGQFTAPAGVTQVQFAFDVDGATIPSGKNVVFGAPLLQAGSARLVDMNLSLPKSECYMLTITDNVSGAPIPGYGPGSGYTCLQPQRTMSSPMNCVNGICDLDSYVPTTTPGAAQVPGQIGPQGPAGAAGPAGSAGQGFRTRGAWTASTTYSPYDVYSYSGTSYLVTAGYTSGSSYGSADTANTTLFASGTAGTDAAAVHTTTSTPQSVGGSLGVGQSLPTLTIFAIGDSLIHQNQDGSGLTTWSALTAALPSGSTIYNWGIQGQTSPQICVRAGACATTITFPGGSIPASGSSATVTFTSGSEPAFNAVTAISFGACATAGKSGVPGTVDGIQGCTVDNGSHVYTWTSISGSGASYSSGPWVSILPTLPAGSI